MTMNEIMIIAGFLTLLIGAFKSGGGRNEVQVGDAYTMVASACLILVGVAL